MALELAHTERTYGRALRLMARTLVQPLRETETLSSTEIVKLFSSTEELADLSEMLLCKLAECVRDWGAQSSVGDAFLQGGEMAMFSGLYVQYVNNYEQSQRMLAACEDKVEWKFFVKHWQVLMAATGRLPSSGQGINNLLIQPVQRIPRYKLLLEQLLKETPEGHPDHEPLTVALTEMSQLAVGVNEAVRRREAVEKVVEMEKRFVGTVELSAPGRWYVRHGKLLKQGRRGKETVTAILFNDALVYAESKVADRGKLTLRRMLCPIERVERASFSEVEFLVFSAEKSLALSAGSREERDSWYHDVHKVCRKLSVGGGASDDLASPRAAEAVAPLWAPNDSATSCSKCLEPFTLMRRRHHCRHCGDLICGPCSESRVHITGLYEDKAVRVCKQCYARVRMQTHAMPADAPPEAMLSMSRSSGIGPGIGSSAIRASGIGGAILTSPSSFPQRASRASLSRASRVSVAMREGGSPGGVVHQGWLQKKGGGGADGTARNWAKGGRRAGHPHTPCVHTRQILSHASRRSPCLPTPRSTPAGSAPPL